MSWRDRDYAGDDGPPRGMGGDWQGVRPTMDNPFTWSVPFFRAYGIAVRVHLIFLLYVLIRLSHSLVQPEDGHGGPINFGLTALWLGCLFVIVLLHEFGHCIACRWTGGHADEILMWPLGGLAFCRPEQRWRAHFITAVGGPMVNVLICAAITPVMWVMTRKFWGVALPNPIGSLIPFEVAGSYTLIALYFINSLSLILLLFNLLPIFPLDGGRICQSLLWPKLGYARSTKMAVYAGYVGAIVLGVAGAVWQEWMLIAIALFGGFMCYATLKNLEYTEAMMGGDSDLFAAAQWTDEVIANGDDGEDRDPPPRQRKERKQDDPAEVDRILAKVSRDGLKSLTKREKRILEQETVRRRGGRPDDG